MRMTYCILACLVFLGGAVRADEAPKPVRIQIQMIAADQAEGESDKVLAKLMPKLKRMPYKRFKQKGSKTVALAAGKKVPVKVGGHTMNLTLESVNEERVRVKVNWLREKDKASIVEITAVTQPDAPFVCGGPREGDVTWIAVFSVK